MGNDTNVNIGNSGEYFVAGELERRGMSDAIEEYRQEGLISQSLLLYNLFRKVVGSENSDLPSVVRLRIAS